jgi:hypothetical protein
MRIAKIVIPIFRSIATTPRDPGDGPLFYPITAWIPAGEIANVERSSMGEFDTASADATGTGSTKDFAGLSPGEGEWRQFEVKYRES